MELDGAIDYEAYGRLIDWQIDAGVAGLVACGTTGESATMTEAEHKEVIRFTVERRQAGCRSSPVPAATAPPRPLP